MSTEQLLELKLAVDVAKVKFGQAIASQHRADKQWLKTQCEQLLGVTAAEAAGLMVFAKKNAALTAVQRHSHFNDEKLAQVPKPVIDALHALDFKLVASKNEQAVTQLSELGLVPAEGVTKLAKWMDARSTKAKGAWGMLGMGVVSSEQDKSERYVCALENVAKNQVLMRIPFQDVISDNVITASELGQALRKHTRNEGPLSKLRPTSGFAAFLASERARTAENPSVYATYLDILPKDFSFLPMFWDAAALAQTKGTLFAGMVEYAKNEYFSDYAALQQHILEPTKAKSGSNIGQFSLQDFLWASAVVISRTFLIAVGKKMTRLLVPFGDMFNHDESKEAAAFAYDPDSKSFFYFACQGIEKGAEVFTSYGPRCNTEFLQGYGFCLQDNLHLNRSQIVYEFDNQAHKFNIVTKPDAKEVLKCFSLLRIILCEDRSLASIYRIDGKKTAGHDVLDLGTMLVRPIHPPNEVSALGALLQGCAASKRQMPGGSSEDDAKLLQNTELDNTTRNALTVRMGEKQVLEHWIHLATHIQQLWAEAGNGDDWAKFSRQLAAHYLTAEATASAEAIAYVKLVWTKWLSIDM